MLLNHAKASLRRTASKVLTGVLFYMTIGLQLGQLSVEKALRNALSMNVFHQKWPSIYSVRGFKPTAAANSVSCL